MAISFRSLVDVVIDQGLKILIYGTAGSGKTVATATTNGASTLIVSAEAGLLSIKDAPKNIQVAEVNSRAQLEEILDYLEKNELPEWVCLDSISEIAEVVLQEEFKKPSGKDPRKAYGEMGNVMIALVKRFRALPTNVVMTAKIDKVNDDGTIMYGPGAPGQILSSALPYLFDLGCAMRVTKDSEGNLVREFQTQTDGKYDAKDRAGKLDTFEKPSLAHIKQKIMGKPQPQKKAA